MKLVAGESLEFSKREALMHALAIEFAQNAVLTSKWLGRVDFGFGPERVKDVGKGIWNPSTYAGTLTIVSDPPGRVRRRGPRRLALQVRLREAPGRPGPTGRIE